MIQRSELKIKKKMTFIMTKFYINTSIGLTFYNYNPFRFSLSLKV